MNILPRPCPWNGQRRLRPTSTRALAAAAAVLVCLAGSPRPAQADGLIVVDRGVVVALPAPPPHPGGRRPHWHHRRPPRPIHRFTPLQVKDHHVTVAIEGPVATTAVDQVFVNPSPHRLEGTYLFPVPEGAQIDRFSMDINGEQVEAELLDADKARGIYEEIVRRARDPALMEYAGQALFKVRIFPIEPRSEKRVKLSYTEVLRRDGRMVAYRYPLNTEKFSPVPIESLSVKVEIRSDQVIKSVYSPSHEIEVARHGEHRVVAGLEGEKVHPDTDLELFFATDPVDGAPIGLSLLTHRPKGAEGEGSFLLLVSPGAWEKDGPVVPKDVVFVVDTSGSMRGDKLKQAQRAISFCIEHLNPDDRFEVVRYSTEAEGLFEKLAPADGEHTDKAQAFVESFKPIGGTAIQEALQLAAAYSKKRPEADRHRPYQVIFLTDGLPTIGETDEDKILASLREAIGEAGARVFCFGIGTKVNTKLLDRITETTRAASEYVLPSEDIEYKVSRFYTKIAEPVLAGLKLDFDGPVRVGKLYPKALPDLFKGDQLVLLGRYRPEGENVHGAVALTGTVAGVKNRFVFEAGFPSVNPANTFIPKLWATRRVGYLLDEIRLHPKKDNAELREEIVNLAREHGIVTPYTSYLILEDEAGRGVPVTRRSLGGVRDGFSRGAGQAAAGGASGFGGEPSAAPFAETARLAEPEARAKEAAAFRSLQKERTGGKSVADARASLALKQADKLYADREANYEAQTADGVYLRPQASRTLKGKTFYQKGSEWIDAAVQTLPAKAEAVKVKFSSEAYFDLLRRHPDAASWLSVGPEVQVLINGVLYEITS